MGPGAGLLLPRPASRSFAALRMTGWPGGEAQGSPQTRVKGDGARRRLFIAPADVEILRCAQDDRPAGLGNPKITANQSQRGGEARRWAFIAPAGVEILRCAQDDRLAGLGNPKITANQSQGGVDFRAFARKSTHGEGEARPGAGFLLPRPALRSFAALRMTSWPGWETQGSPQTRVKGG